MKEVGVALSLSLSLKTEPQGKTSTTMASHSTITISIKDQSNDIVYLRVGRDVNIKKVLQTYCQGKQVEYGTLNFFLHGNRLSRTGTVAQVGLVDGDEIDAMGYASGGGPSN